MVIATLDSDAAISAGGARNLAETMAAPAGHHPQAAGDPVHGVLGVDVRYVSISQLVVQGDNAPGPSKMIALAAAASPAEDAVLARRPGSGRWRHDNLAYCGCHMDGCRHISRWPSHAASHLGPPSDPDRRLGRAVAVQAAR